QDFSNPYIGIIVFLIIPAIFVLGLILMPVGAFLAARRLGGYRQLLTRVPPDPARMATLGWTFAFATLANAGILMLAAYHGLGEQCHSSEKAKDNRLKVIRQYGDDEKSTEKITVLLMKVGSRIHKAHVGRDIQYLGDSPDPQTISTVIAGGKTYSVEGPKTGGVTRKMDCMDCHNRSGHDFETPESAVDRAIASGQLDRSRPFARRDAVTALKTQSGLEAQPPSVQMIRSGNVFPQMSISWGTYPN